MNDLPDVHQWVLDAEKRIRDYIRETPLEYSPYLSKLGNCNVFLKLENVQLTGSFKVRGAMNKVLSLTKKEAITATTGNHGLAVAYALQKIGGTGRIYLPTVTAQVKREALENYDVELVYYGSESAESEIYARSIAEKEKKTFISPYNDQEIIGGQGTIAIELLRQLKDKEIHNIFVTIGGGGLISGISGYLKIKQPNVKIIGCLPSNSPVMYESIKMGKIIEMDIKPTLSDGSAGGIEPHSITFNLCQRYVDKYILVDEQAIADAIKLILEKHHMVIEGAAGVTVAAYLKEALKSDRLEGKNVILIICGSNIGLKILRQILCNEIH
ncbi:MAG: threonine/serine dehydratase [Candidatus Hodarchaeota archaeon]